MKQKQPTIACNESVHQYDPFREIGPTKNRWGSKFTFAMEYIAVTYVTPSTTPTEGKVNYFVFSRKREQVQSRLLKPPKDSSRSPFTPGRPNCPGPTRPLPHHPAHPCRVRRSRCGSPSAGALRGEAHPGSRARTPYDSTMMLGNASRQGIYLDSRSPCCLAGGRGSG